MIAWLQRFIPHLSTMADPLNNLKRKDVPFLWNDQCERAFCQIKISISNAVTLSIPDFSIPFEIHTDASNVGIGACLVQIVNGERRIIAFSSRSLNHAKRNYSATKKEILAIVN
jgi:hypothetical protein